MISLKVIDTDKFLDMPLSTRYLYHELNARADDDGFIGSPKKIAKMVGGSDDDLKLLTAKEFIIPFQSGVIVIKHWRVNNYIRPDRYAPTIYVAEKQALSMDKTGVYDLVGIPDGIPSGNQMVGSMEPQDRLGKDRLGKDRDNMSPDEPAVSRSKTNYSLIRDLFIAHCPSLSEPIPADKWTSTRKKAVRGKDLSPEAFAEVFDRVEQSDFLTGRNGKWPNGCSFDWILKPANWQKIIEGTYDNRRNSKSTKSDKATYDIDAYEKLSMQVPELEDIP